MDMTPSQRIDLERTKEQVVERKLKAYEQLSMLVSMTEGFGPNAKDKPEVWTNAGYKDAALSIINQSRKDCEKLITACEKRWP